MRLAGGISRSTGLFYPTTTIVHFMTHSVSDLNALLGRSLGFDPYGTPKFMWMWSEDLVWPQFPTGSTVTQQVEVPLIGGGVDVECSDCGGGGFIGMYESSAEPCCACAGKGTILKTTWTVNSVVPEYKVEKMCPKLDRQWVIALWYAPEELAHWESRFPCADYPARGYRINTNASLPSYPGGPREPNIRDTERFIELLREQRSMSHHDRVVDMLAEDDRQKAAIQQEIEDEIANDFTAFMNPEPGKRGGFVSFPSTEKESGTLVQ